MIAQHVEKNEAPAKPMMKPLSDIEIQDDFCLEGGSPFTITSIWNQKDQALCNMETEESAFTDQDSDPCTRKRHLNDLFSNSISKRCMMSKLERMDRAPIKRRHY